MGWKWQRSLICFLSRHGGEVEDEHSSPSPSPSSTSPSLPHKVSGASQQQHRKAGWKERNLCLYSWDVVAPCTTRSKTRAAVHGDELQSPKEEGSDGAAQERPISSRESGKRTRKENATKSQAAKKRENDLGSEDSSKCELCKASPGIDPFVTSCKHICCRGCLKEHFQKVIHTQLSATELTFENLIPQIVCPNHSCKEELSHRELVDLLGSKPVKLYDSWIVCISDKLYRPSLTSSRVKCTNSTCAEEATPTAVLASKISSLSASEVRRALEVRSAEKKYLTQSCVRELSKAVGYDSEMEGDVWLCTRCDASWCAACGCQLPVVVTRRDRSKVHRRCQAKQRYEIYKSLVELEGSRKAYTQGRQSPSKRNSKSLNSCKTIWAGGTGYGGEYVDNKQLAENTQAAAKKAELELDSQVEKHIFFLTSVLKGNDGNGKENKPSLAVSSCAMLGWEDALSGLLLHFTANDSMLDISGRSTLYLNLVSLLGAIQQHVELRPILIGCTKQDRVRNDESWIDQWAGLERSTSKGRTTAEDEHEVDKDNSLVQKMGNIYRQAKVMLQNMPQTDRNHGLEVDISLAREICKCYESPQGVFSEQEIPLGDAVKGLKAKKLGIVKEGMKVEVSATEYKEALKQMQFRQLRMIDEKGDYKHYYKEQIAGRAANSTCIDKRGAHNHKRMIHLSKEIASLATTLPLEWESSIHLCVDESRVDVLRALIIGPQGTPYQNGLFFFDVFLPPDYPQVPPCVHFLTTGGGKVRFNPNLYDTGKICLSLLGTWSGPGWVPGKSTLLQVLVSIQSLIFVKDPYYNEPGYEQTTSPEAEKENRRHREHTLSLAVLAPLRKPDPFFAEIVREHFRFKQQEVETQCDDWVAAIPEKYARQRLSNLAKDIKTELQILCSRRD